ncbi:MAG: Crp/Fnr family transcriptional regulator [Candidatus Omnitrophota bacterium]|nr:Crp/Fnr family transcriptional regulator [Candidatus Omnitrophota bacterium]
MNLNVLIRENPLFLSLTRKQLENINHIALIKKYKKEELIFSEGDLAKGFYLVISGRIKVYKLSSSGKEFILDIFTTGQTIAEAAIFSGETFPAYAEALTDSQLLYIPKAEFLRLLKESPDLSLKMLSSFSQRLRKFSVAIEELSLKEVTSRLARYILELSKQSGLRTPKGIECKLNLTKEQLAKSLGTISETLSRSLKKLKEKKAISIQANKITILNLKFLESISSGSKI